MHSVSDENKPGLYSLGTRIYRIIQLSVTCILLLGLLYGWHWLSDPNEFPIRSVKMESSYEHISQQALQSETLPYLSQGMIRLHAGEMKAQLLKFPWIAAVDIKRVWPDAVIIKITEQEAVARWDKDGLLNSAGQIFTPPADTIPTDLPLLTGPSDQATLMWTTYAQIAEVLKPLQLGIRELTMNDRLSLRMTLTNGTQVLLGKTDPLLRLQRFVKVYSRIFTQAEAQAEYIDLRYENGLSIKWRNNGQNNPGAQVKKVANDDANV